MNKKLPIGFTERKNGNLMYRFTIAGKRETVYGATVAECKDKETQRRLDIEKGVRRSGDDKKITLNQFFDAYMEHHRKSIKESTAVRMLDKFRIVRETIGRERITKIDRKMLLGFRDELIQEMERRKREKEKQWKSGNVKENITVYTEEHINRIFALLYTLFEEATAQDIIDKNPCLRIKRLKVNKPPVDETIHRALTDTEIELLFINP